MGLPASRQRPAAEPRSCTSFRPASRLRSRARKSPNGGKAGVPRSGALSQGSIGRVGAIGGGGANSITATTVARIKPGRRRAQEKRDVARPKNVAAAPALQAETPTSSRERQHYVDSRAGQRTKRYKNADIRHECASAGQSRRKAPPIVSSGWNEASGGHRSTTSAEHPERQGRSHTGLPRPAP